MGCEDHMVRAVDPRLGAVELRRDFPGIPHDFPGKSPRDSEKSPSDFPNLNPIWRCFRQTLPTFLQTPMLARMACCESQSAAHFAQ